MRSRLEDMLVTALFLSISWSENFKKKGGSKSCLKVELKKAFDSVNKEFIYFLMHCMGFPYVQINWIRECISSPIFSIMVNDSFSLE